MEQKRRARFTDMHGFRKSDEVFYDPFDLRDYLANAFHWKFEGSGKPHSNEWDLGRYSVRTRFDPYGDPLDIVAEVGLRLFTEYDGPHVSLGNVTVTIGWEKFDVPGAEGGDWDYMAGKLMQTVRDNIGSPDEDSDEDDY